MHSLYKIMLCRSLLQSRAFFTVRDQLQRNQPPFRFIRNMAKKIKACFVDQIMVCNILITRLARAGLSPKTSK